LAGWRRRRRWALGKDWALPIGVVQNVSLSHNKGFARFWELGSERSYFIAGRTQGQLGLSRIMYHGPSLLRMLYAYYQDLIPPTVVPFVFPNVAPTTVANPHDVKIPPGFENIFLNLASDLFSQPVGVLLYFRDSNEDTVGATYLEACYIPSHSDRHGCRRHCHPGAGDGKLRTCCPGRRQGPRAHQGRLQRHHGLLSKLGGFYGSHFGRCCLPEMGAGAPGLRGFVSQGCSSSGYRPRMQP
jgi:hypothetical protein